MAIESGTRLVREAKLHAAPNHVHIGAVYGLDEHEGPLFIAMKLIEGAVPTAEADLQD